MKIEIGYYRCRNGSRARVLCVDAPSDYPVVGYVELKNGSCVVIRWTAEGQYFHGAEQCLHEHDLIEPWCDESEPEQLVTLPLSKLRGMLFDASEAAEDGDLLTNSKLDSWLVEQGILPAPAPQPVRVSGWVNVYENGFISSVHADEATATCQTKSGRIATVYVTGTEGVGPEDGQ